MRILTPENTVFDVTQIVDGISQQKCAILDASDPKNIDYFFVNLTFFNEYEYPAVELQIGPYTLEVPMNWRILTGDSHQGDLELIDLEELPNFDYDAFVLNPFKSYTPTFMPVQIRNSYTSVTSWFTPKLQKKQILAVPLGDPSQWESRVNPDTKVETIYPLCCFFCDDSDKMNDVLDIRDVF